MEKDEIREIGGKKYKVVRTPCTCICHSMPEGHVKHMIACCNGGYKQRLVLLPGETKDIVTDSIDKI